MFQFTVFFFSGQQWVRQHEVKDTQSSYTGLTFGADRYMMIAVPIGMRE